MMYLVLNVFVAGAIATNEGKWDVATNEAVCVKAECAPTHQAFYYYTATGTATTGLTDKHVYQAIRVGSTQKFTLNNASVKIGFATIQVGSAMSISASGAGNTYQRVRYWAGITNTESVTNKLIIRCGNCDWNTWLAAFDPAGTPLTYWCPDPSGGLCDYNIAGAVSGNQYKTKLQAERADPSLKIILTSTSGTDEIDVTTNGMPANGDGGGMVLAMHSDAPIVFPAAATTTTTTTTAGSAGSGSGSAARSFALLGSAFAMATAFLLA